MQGPVVAAPDCPAKKKKRGTGRAFSDPRSNPDYFPIFTSVTSKMTVAFGGKPFAGFAP